MPHTPVTAFAPRSVAQWRASVAQAADLVALLANCRDAALANPPLALWTGQPSMAQWQGQADSLKHRLIEPLSRAELVQRCPMLGVPFAATDSIAGVPAIAALQVFSHAPARRAIVVHRLLDAGAVWLGGFSMDQFAAVRAGLFLAPGDLAVVHRLAGAGRRPLRARLPVRGADLEFGTRHRPFRRLARLPRPF